MFARILRKSASLLAFLFLFLFVIANRSYAYDLESLKQDLSYLRTQGVQATLLFTPFGSNPDPNFVKHRLSDEQVQDLCDGDCASINMGANFGTFYKGGNYDRARSNDMNWSLEIAQSGSEDAIAGVINSEGIANVVIRIGVGGSSYGFDNPNDYIAFLNRISAKVGGKEFYAIAGPNEPDLENWIAPACGGPGAGDNRYYDCIGEKLANYMNAVVGAGLPSNIRLLSPAFNMTSYTFNDNGYGIPLAMLRKGARFDLLTAIAGNIYPNGDSMTNIWNNHVSSVISQLGKPVVVTETGPWESVEGTGTLGGFDTSLYDFYDANFDQFYLHPIKGIQNKDTITIIDDLVDQGYQAYCATPRYYLESSLGPMDVVRRFVYGLGQSATLSFGSKENVDLTQVETPVFRDVSRKRFLMSSIEEFFGFTDTKVSQPSEVEIKSAPINSLLSEKQRCDQSIQVLSRVERLCQRLKNPDDCALADRPIPDTNYTYKTLLGAVRGLPAGVSSEYESRCQYWENLEPNNQEVKAIVAALRTTPLYLDRSYRLAFLVVAVDKVGKTDGQLFNLFRTSNPGVWKHEVAVLPFKIPDVGTNQGVNQEDSSYLNWGDPLELTSKSLTTVKQQTENSEYRLQAIDKLKQSSKVAQDQDISDKIKIRCRARTSDKYCDEPGIGQAVIDVINGQAIEPNLASAMLCGNPTVEKTDTILDSASIRPDPEEQLIFKADFGRQLLENILESNVSLEFQTDYEVNARSLARGGTTKTSVDFYLLYPVGTDMRVLQQALSGTFFSQNELASLNYGDALKREGFELQKSVQDFDEGNDDFSYDDNCQSVEVAPGVYDYRCDKKTFAGTIDNERQDPARILGGDLGYWMRIIQLNLHKLTSAPRRFLASCKTTEEFLLGKCSGPDVSPKYFKAEPTIPIVGEYCSVLEDQVTSGSLNYQLCEHTIMGAPCRTPLSRSDANYFIDEDSQLRLGARVLFADGATLLLTGQPVPTNPGQFAASRCEKGSGAGIEIWYLPLNFAGDLNSYDNWNKESVKLKYVGNPSVFLPTDRYVNLKVDLAVKPGYYQIFPLVTGCFSSATDYRNGAGGASNNPVKISQSWVKLEEPSSDLAAASAETSVCYHVALNSNMPGGYTDKVTEIPNCDVLNSPYDLSLNTSCGGLKGELQNDRWQNLTGLKTDAYFSYFRRRFNPSENVDDDPALTCGDLFPNSHVKVDCSRL